MSEKTLSKVRKQEGTLMVFSKKGVRAIHCRELMFKGSEFTADKVVIEALGCDENSEAYFLPLSL